MPCYPHFDMKLTKTKKHDSLSLRIAEGKSWMRLSVSRSGWKITGRGNDMRRTAEMAKLLFEEALEAGFNYGDALEYVESEIQG